MTTYSTEHGNAITAQCPNCGGTISYDPIAQQVRCEHCSSDLAENAAELEIPLETQLPLPGPVEHILDEKGFFERAPWSEPTSTMNTRVYSCPSCDAKIVADQSVVSTSCPYCGNNMLVSGTAIEDNIPAKIIPFALSQEEARRHMQEHLANRREINYLPKTFDPHVEHMVGVYVPFYIFELQVDGRYALIGTSVDHSEEHVYYLVTCSGHSVFENAPVDGSSKMPDAHMDSIGPFEFGSALDFSAEYAAGFLMEVADESPEECFRRVESRARNTFDIGVKLSIRDEYG